jgi:large subunit ribosomal protein L21e
VDVRGKAYVVETYLGDKKKIIITTADHLRPYQGGS